VTSRVQSGVLAQLPHPLSAYEKRCTLFAPHVAGQHSHLGQSEQFMLFYQFWGDIITNKLNEGY
ncbi:hypothetical protein O5269_28545, partial [Escherichia coli]|nr:hypothetical protein [Escherichia coli]